MRWIVGIVVLLSCARFGVAQEVVSSSSGAKFRLVSGGRFIQGTTGGERKLMGAFPLSTTGQFYGNAEAPAHVTWITKPYYLADAEVTVGQFKAFVAATKYQTTVERGQSEMVGWDPTSDDKPLYQSHDFARDTRFSWRDPGFEQTDQHPVVGVSWADAQAYCEWLSEQDKVRYRLPTEAEWEFACRAGTTTWFSFGDNARDAAHRHGNFGNVELEQHRKHAAERQWLLDWDNAQPDGHIFTAPVRSFETNPWGMHDMHGNVWEWCDDLWLDTIYKDYARPKYNEPAKVAIDPINRDRPQTPANNFHVIRGGCWYNGDLYCRSANRTYWDREDAACYVGFRLARDADSSAPTSARDAYDAEVAAIKDIEAAGGKLYSSDGLDIEVRFDGDSFNEAVLSRLQLLPELQRLRIHWRKRDTRLSNRAFEEIAKLQKLESVEFGCDLDLDAINLSLLCELKRLKRLRFPRSAPLNDGHLAALSDLTTLTEFVCFGTNGGLTDDGIVQLKDNRQLEVLETRETEATGGYLAEFVGCPLRSLAATRKYRGDATLTDEACATLARFPTLETLILHGESSLTKSTMQVITSLPRLQDLQIDECSGFEDEDFATLDQLQRLRSLSAIKTQAGDIAAAAIGKIPRIETLRLSGGELTDQGIEALTSAFSIRRLEIESSKVTDEGVRRLGRMNRLETLTIQSPRVTGSGLGPIIELPGLRELSLITSSLENVAFDYLSRTKTIEKLRLAHRGHRPPAKLTDDGMMRMQQVKGMREIWLPRNDTGMTEAKMKELDKLMPKTNVIIYTVEWE